MVRLDRAARSANLAAADNSAAAQKHMAPEPTLRRQLSLPSGAFPGRAGCCLEALPSKGEPVEIPELSVEAPKVSLLDTSCTQRWLRTRGLRARAVPLEVEADVAALFSALDIQFEGMVLTRFLVMVLRALRDILDGTTHGSKLKDLIGRLANNIENLPGAHVDRSTFLRLFLPLATQHPDFLEDVPFRAAAQTALRRLELSQVVPSMEVNGRPIAESFDRPSTAGGSRALHPNEVALCKSPLPGRGREFHADARSVPAIDSPGARARSSSRPMASVSSSTRVALSTSLQSASGGSSASLRRNSSRACRKTENISQAALGDYGPTSPASPQKTSSLAPTSQSSNLRPSSGAFASAIGHCLRSSHGGNSSPSHLLTGNACDDPVGLIQPDDLGEEPLAVWHAASPSGRERTFGIVTLEAAKSESALHACTSMAHSGLHHMGVQLPNVTSSCSGRTGTALQNRGGARLGSLIGATAAVGATTAPTATSQHVHALNKEAHFESGSRNLRSDGNRPNSPPPMERHQRFGALSTAWGESGTHTSSSNIDTVPGNGHAATRKIHTSDRDISIASKHTSRSKSQQRRRSWLF